MIKKENHLYEVKPINEKKIDNSELIKIMSCKAGNSCNFNSKIINM